MPQTPASHHTIWVSYNHKEEEEEKRKNISKPQKEEATNSC